MNLTSAMLERVPSEIRVPPLQALGKWLLVKLVPRVDRVGLVHLPEGKYAHAEDLAVVVSVGRGGVAAGKVILHDVSPGAVVVVVRLHEVTESQKAWQAVVGKDFLFLQDSDIFFEVECPPVSIIVDPDWEGAAS